MPKNDLIFKRLEQATEAERKAICEILGLKSEYTNNIGKISKELRSVSGHSIMNTIRGIVNIFQDPHNLKYIEILKDTYLGIENWVDKELKVSYSKKEFNKDTANEYELENEIEKL